MCISNSQMYLNGEAIENQDVEKKYTSVLVRMLVAEKSICYR